MNIGNLILNIVILLIFLAGFGIGGFYVYKWIQKRNAEKKAQE